MQNLSAAVSLFVVDDLPYFEPLIYSTLTIFLFSVGIFICLFLRHCYNQ